MRTPVPTFVRPVVHMYRHEVPSPIGAFFIYANSKGEVCCANFTDREKPSLEEISNKFYKSCDVVFHREANPAESTPGAESAKLLGAYFAFHGANASGLAASPFADLAHHAAGKDFEAVPSRKRRREEEEVRVVSTLHSLEAQRHEMDALLSRIPIALAPDVSPFLRQVWRTLHTTVPSGTVTTYKKLGDVVAAEAKKERMSARAIGTAMGSNPICLIVPCHRVLASNLSLNGYGCGLYRKVWLLRHELAEGVPAEKMRRVEKETQVSTAESRK